MEGGSIILLSPTNQVLLLHRVGHSNNYPSAHVFPGGNLSEFHETDIPPPGSPERHADGRAYRLASIRETFEESGILLARQRGAGGNGPLLNVPLKEKAEGRKKIRNNGVRFEEWVSQLSGVPDVGKCPTTCPDAP